MTTHTPQRCSFSTMSAFPTGTNKVVLMNSGNYPSFSSYLNDTWQFTGTDWTNSSGSNFNSAPVPGRNDAVMAYDGTNVMLYGGRSSSSTGGVLQDTWTYNGNTWTLAAPATTPFGRYKAEAAYLSGTGVVMFGGFGGAGNGVFLNETWVWNGTTWSQVSVANGAGPAARVDHCFAASASACVLFGGAGTNSLFGDTWSFSGGAWTHVSTTGSPAARSQACMAFSTAGGLYVLFGGQNGAQYLNDTWVYNPGTTTWTQVTGSGPAGRVGAEMAYDATSSKVIMFGGNSATSNYPSNETWAFDAVGLTWTQL